MTLLLSKLLFSGVNFLVLDNDYNYNYLPTNNTYSSNKLLYKTINYFNIRVLFFLNLKPGTIKKFSNLNLLNITLTNNYNLNNVGFSSKFKNLRIFHYMLYIYILGVYSTMQYLYIVCVFVIQQFFFFNFLTHVVNILFLGTFLTYLIYIFLINSKQQVLNKNDYGYNLIKNLLIFILGISFILFLFFIFYFFKFCKVSCFYSVYHMFLILPNIHVNFFYNWFEFSVDFFGIVLLLLGYFIGVLSLLALDNRIF